MNWRRCIDARLKWLFAGSVAAAAVLGQPLKFETGPAAPEAGTGRHVHAMVERLKAGEADETPAGIARRRVRLLAAALLERGEAMGESGSALVVRGLLLARAEREIEGRGDEALAWLADDLAALSEGLNAGWDISALDRGLRDAFSLLGAPPNGAVAWDEERWRELQSEDWALKGVLREVEALLADASRVTAYSRSAAMIRGAVVEAGWLAQRRPAWVTPEAHAAYASRLESACRRLLDPDRRAEAGESLRRLARAGRIAALLDGLERSTASQRVQGAFAAHVADGGASPVLPTFERFVLLTERRVRPGEERETARPLRPAFTPLAAAARQSRGSLVEALARGLDARSGATDPALLEAAEAHRRRMEDIELVRRLERVIALPPPRAGLEAQVKPEFAVVAQRLMALGNDMGEPRLAEVALTQFRELADRLVRYHALPAEGALRAALAADAPGFEAWEAATAGQAAQLAARIDERRAAFLDAWSDRRGVKAAQAEEAAAALEALQAALPLIADTAALHGLEGEWAVRPWCALSAEAAAFLQSHSAGLGEELTRIALGGEGALEATRLEHAAALLIGRIARLHGGEFLAVDVLCFGPAAVGEPYSTAVEAHAETVALVCRYLEEAAREEDAPAIMRFVGAAAQRVPSGAFAAE